MSSDTIAVRLYNIFSRYLPSNADQYPIAPETTLRRVICSLGIPENEQRWMLVFLNGRLTMDLSAPLKARDEVKVFLALGGG